MVNSINDIFELKLISFEFQMIKRSIAYLGSVIIVKNRMMCVVMMSIYWKV